MQVPETKYSFRSNCTNCNTSKPFSSTSIQQLSLSKQQGIMQTKSTPEFISSEIFIWLSTFLRFNKTLCFILQHCNKTIGIYFEKCGKVTALSSDYKMICIDEYCRQGDKNSTCDTYSELSRLCASDGPGTYESWREDSDVVCGRFYILL